MTGLGTDLTHALKDVRVLDFTRLLPGPYGTLLLADLGADVVKIEQPGAGDYMRMLPPLIDGVGARFRAVNRGKRSLALDLRAPEGRDVALKLMAGADVVIEGFRPGVMDRLGLGFDAAKAQRPDVIFCSLSGYGADGPYVDRAGHDLNYLALSGLLNELDHGSAPPHPLPVQLADLVGGGIFGVVLVLAALQRRQVAGKPEAQRIDLSLTEGMLALLGPELAELLAAGEDRAAPGAGWLTGGLANYGVYRTADEKLLAVGSLEPKFEGPLAELLGFEARFDDLTAGPERHVALREELAGILASRSREDWMELLSEHDVCCEPVLTPTELSAHPQHRARGCFRPGELPGGVSSEGPVHTPGTRVGVEVVAPQLGEHSREILAEAGLDPAQIDALVEAQIAVQFAPD